MELLEAVLVAFSSREVVGGWHSRGDCRLKSSASYLQL